MKRLGLLLVLVILLLNSCGSPGSTVFIPVGEFTADMEYISQEFCFCARVVSRGYSDILLNITAPETLSGMTVEINEAGIVATLEGIDYTFDELKLTDRPGLAFAAFALRRFLYTDCDYFETSDGYSARTESSYGTLSADCSKDGFLKSVSVGNTAILLTQIKSTEDS